MVKYAIIKFRVPYSSEVQYNSDFVVLKILVTLLVKWMCVMSASAFETTLQYTPHVHKHIYTHAMKQNCEKDPRNTSHKTYHAYLVCVCMSIYTYWKVKDILNYNTTNSKFEYGKYGKCHPSHILTAGVCLNFSTSNFHLGLPNSY